MFNFSISPRFELFLKRRFPKYALYVLLPFLSCPSLFEIRAQASPVGVGGPEGESDRVEFEVSTSGPISHGQNGNDGMPVHGTEGVMEEGEDDRQKDEDGEQQVDLSSEESDHVGHPRELSHKNAVHKLRTSKSPTNSTSTSSNGTGSTSGNTSSTSSNLAHEPLSSDGHSGERQNAGQDKQPVGGLSSSPPEDVDHDEDGVHHNFIVQGMVDTPEQLLEWCKKAAEDKKLLIVTNEDPSVFFPGFSDNAERYLNTHCYIVMSNPGVVCRALKIYIKIAIYGVVVCPRLEGNTLLTKWDPIFPGSDYLSRLCSEGAESDLKPDDFFLHLSYFSYHTIQSKV
ncbi:hypothetical protein [Candidatus Similichlamydia laticola]|nr:hypothetical protein [Candidatus Similichlamydia laticola]